MRGQAFEVFRLLIAAVVAGAILMVLLGLLGGITTPTTDPQSATEQLVKKFSINGGTGSTDYIEFRKGMAIDAEAIAVAASLDKECVYIDTQNLPTGFDACESNKGKCVEYTRNIGMKARIKVRCTVNDNYDNYTNNQTKCPVECTISILKD